MEGAMLVVTIKDESELFEKIAKEFNEIQKAYKLFKVDLTNEEIKEVYYKHIPKEPVFRVNPVWDCFTCRHAIYKISKIVTICNGQATSVLRLFLGTFEPIGPISFFKNMFLELAALAEVRKVTSSFTTKEREWGAKSSTRTCDDDMYVFSHFYFNIRDEFVEKDVSGETSRVQSIQACIEKYVDHVSVMYDVLDFISQGVIYRGTEKEKVVRRTIQVLEKYLENRPDATLFAWENAGSYLANADVIGTLIDDLIIGVEAEQAIKNYNLKVSPANYRQPKVEVVTQRQVLETEKKIKELGFDDLMNSFEFATKEDLPVKYVLWTTRMKRDDGILDVLRNNIKVVPSREGGDEITFEQFLQILRNVTEVEVDVSTLTKVTLIKNSGPPFYAWGTNIGFCYETGLADADLVTQRVAKFGGKINADFRISLYWENLDDLDLHLIKKVLDHSRSTIHIYYGRKTAPATTFRLDIDMNVSAPIRGAVENIYSKSLLREEDGEFTVYVRNFTQRERAKRVLVSLYDKNRLIRTYEIENPPYNREKGICTFSVQGGKVAEIKDLVAPVFTDANPTFVAVSDILYSPNYWDGATSSGNKHVFFMTPRTDINLDYIRPFNTEQVHKNLVPFRRVLQVLSRKIKIKGNPILVGYGVSFGRERKLKLKVNKRPFTLIISPQNVLQEEVAFEPKQKMRV